MPTFSDPVAALSLLLAGGNCIAQTASDAEAVVRTANELYYAALSARDNYERWNRYGHNRQMM